MSAGISAASSLARVSDRAAIAFSARPLVLRERLRTDSHPVGRVERALHLGEHDAGLDVELGHLPTARIGEPPLQAGTETERFERLDETP
jgi:hypothetical protein